jgi:hypothetical protein
MGRSLGCALWWVVASSVLVAPVVARAQEAVLSEATVHLHFKTRLLQELGIALTGASGNPDPTEPLLHDHASTLRGSLVIRLPGGSYEGFGSGALLRGKGPMLHGPGGSASLGAFQLVAGAEPLSLAVLDSSGRPLFDVDHIHTHHDPTSGALELRNADLRIAPELALRLGEPRLSGIAVALFELATTLDAGVGRTEALRIPSGAGAAGGGSCVTPDFTLPVDVALVDVSSLQQSALEQGRVAITPSARLRNVGQGDVRWEMALDPDHPMLAWALYRRTGEAFEQIGTSATKHAFFAQNSGCPCPGGAVLWAGGCEDVYGVFTNEDRANLAPRDEITAHLAAWDPCGSFFDPDCNGVENFPPPADGLERRMSVAAAELDVPGATYYIEAWYVVAGDIDIFNTMGWRRVSPSFSGGFWSFALDTPLANGPALDAWVLPGTLEATESSQVLATGEGHVQVASRVEDLGGGLHRYHYALLNLDFDRQLRRLAIPLTVGASVSQIAFSDETDDPTDDWSASVGPASVSFVAPPLLGLDWGRMARFAFTVDAAPEVATLTVEPLEPGSPTSCPVDAAIPVPEPDLIVQLPPALLLLALLARRRGRSAAIARAAGLRSLGRSGALLPGGGALRAPGGEAHP